jgi:hypothetical protein
MSGIYRQIIDHPNAWTPATASKQSFSRPLEPVHLQALERLLAATRDRDPVQVTRADFDAPAINTLMIEVRDTIMKGCGVVILTGLTRERYSDNDFKRIYWGLGTHLGRGLPQSRRMEMLGLVQEEEENTTQRGYRSSAALGMHTDAFEIVGLMCVQRAQSGGESSLASALTIHNEILKNRPELLTPLYEGFYFTLQELQFTERPTTAEKVPVFCNVDGVVSCNYAASYMRRAAELRNVPFPQDLDEALKYFDATAQRPDVRAEFMLEPGDMMLWNNYTHLHSRRAFKSSPERRRLLLRLWLEVAHGRRVTPGMALRGKSFEWIYGAPPGVAAAGPGDARATL